MATSPPPPPPQPNQWGEYPGGGTGNIPGVTVDAPGDAGKKLNPEGSTSTSSGVDVPGDVSRKLKEIGGSSTTTDMEQRLEERYAAEDFRKYGIGGWSVDGKKFATEAEANAEVARLTAEQDKLYKNQTAFYDLLDRFRGSSKINKLASPPIPLNPNYVPKTDRPGADYAIGGTTERPNPTTRPNPGNNIADAIQPGKILEGVRESTNLKIIQRNSEISALFPDVVKSDIQRAHDYFNKTINEVENIQTEAGKRANQTEKQTASDTLKRDVLFTVGDTAFHAAKDITENPVTFASNIFIGGAIVKGAGLAVGMYPGLARGLSLGATINKVPGVKSATKIITPINIAGAAMLGVYGAETVKNYGQSYEEASTKPGFNAREFAGAYRGKVAAELIGMTVGGRIASTVTIASLTDNMKSANKILRSGIKSELAESARMINIATGGKADAVFRVVRTGKVPYDPVRVANSVFEVATASKNMKSILITDAMRKKAIKMGYDVDKLEAELSKGIDIGYKKPLSGNSVDYYKKKGVTPTELPAGFDKEPSFKMLDPSTKNKLIDKYTNAKIRESISKEPLRVVSEKDDFVSKANKAHAESMRKAENLVKSGKVYIQDIKEAYVKRQRSTIALEGGQMKTVQVMERQKVRLISKDELMKTHLNSLTVAEGILKTEDIGFIGEIKHGRVKPIDVFAKSKMRLKTEAFNSFIQNQPKVRGKYIMPDSTGDAEWAVDYFAGLKTETTTATKSASVSVAKSASVSVAKSASIVGFKSINAMAQPQKKKQATLPAVANAIKVMHNIIPGNDQKDQIKPRLILPPGFSIVPPPIPQKIINPARLRTPQNTPPKPPEKKPPRNSPPRETPPEKPPRKPPKVPPPIIPTLTPTQMEEAISKYIRKKKHIHVWNIKNPVPSLMGYVFG